MYFYLFHCVIFNYTIIGIIKYNLYLVMWSHRIEFPYYIKWGHYSMKFEWVQPNLMSKYLFRWPIRYPAAYADNLSGICEKSSLQFASVNRMQTKSCVRQPSGAIGKQACVPRTFIGKLPYSADASGTTYKLLV